MCRRLQEAGIRVDTLILIESTLAVPVPGNVCRCINLYKSNPGRDWVVVFRGLPVAAEGCTQLMNVDVRHTPQLAYLCRYEHLMMATAWDVQKLVVQLIDACHAGCHRSTPCRQPVVVDQPTTAADVNAHSIPRYRRGP